MLGVYPWEESSPTLPKGNREGVDPGKRREETGEGTRRSEGRKNCYKDVIYRKTIKVKKFKNSIVEWVLVNFHD